MLKHRSRNDAFWFARVVNPKLWYLGVKFTSELNRLVHHRLNHPLFMIHFNEVDRLPEFVLIVGQFHQNSWWCHYFSGHFFRWTRHFLGWMSGVKREMSVLNHNKQIFEKVNLISNHFIFNKESSLLIVFSARLLTWIY